MAFGPIIGGSSGGGGGSSSPVVTLTATVESVTNDGIGDPFVDVDVALPEGVTRCLVVGCSLTRTDGDAALLGLWAWPNDARSGSPLYLIGGEFSGGDITGNDVPVYGPRADVFGSISRNTPSYVNESGSEFIRARVTNPDNDSIADVTVTFKVIPW